MKEIPQIDRDIEHLVKTRFLLRADLQVIIITISRKQIQPSSPVYKKQLSCEGWTMCVCVLAASRWQGFQVCCIFGGAKICQHVRARKWICGFVQVDLQNPLGSGFLEISLSAGFWQIIGCGILRFWDIRHSNQRSVMVQDRDYMQWSCAMIIFHMNPIFVIVIVARPPPW